jgi:hypothetical protein
MPALSVRSRLGRLGRTGGCLALGCTTFLAISCGRQGKSVYPVRGQVLYEGKPLANAFVVCHPLEKTARAVRPSATTDTDGWFCLSTYQTDDGAPPGDYTVTVEWRKVTVIDSETSELSGNLLPARYSKPQTSKLRINVIAGANENHYLRLTRK